MGAFERLIEYKTNLYSTHDLNGCFQQVSGYYYFAIGYTLMSYENSLNFNVSSQSVLGTLENFF